MTSRKGRGRMRSRRKIMLVVSACVLLFCVGSTIAADVICGVIFCRVDVAHPLSPDYNDLEAPPARTQVMFPCGENTLAGYLYEAEDPRGLVLMVHGMRGNGDAHLSETRCFVEQGYTVFAFDGTGTRGSTGDGTVGLSQMVSDVRAAVAYLSESDATAHLPLLLYGHSMGGYAAVVAAEEEAVCGVVSVAGFESPMAVMLQSGRRYVGEVAVLGYPFLYLQNQLTFGSYADRHATDAINASSAAFLIVHGAADAVIPPSESIYGHRAGVTNPRVTYRLIEDEGRDGHSEAWLSVEAVAYREELEDCLAALEVQYPDGIPEDVLAAFADSVDRERLYEVDEGFIEEVVAFFEGVRGG